MTDNTTDEVWSGDQGDHWVHHADRYDGMLVPFGDELMAAAGLEAGDRVADIGCGCGATTVSAGLAVGPRGTVRGFDLSPQMLNLARSRASDAHLDQTDFEVADVQQHSFEPEQLDTIISRFGVMFFDDPPAAFANLASALRPGGRLAFVCWQSLGDNEWLIGPGLAIAEHVGLPELGTPGGPGPFSMADSDQTRELLSKVGFVDIDIVAVQPEVALGGESDVDEIVDFLATGGPGRAVLADADEESKKKALEALRGVIAEHHDGQRALFGSGAWIVTARKGG